MNFPHWVIGIVILCISIYTMGYAITLWREKNRLGFFAVTMLALFVIILPIIASKR